MNESEEFKMAFHKNDSDKNVSYEVIEDYGAFGQPDKYGYQLRLREVSWNGKDPRYDIRPWMTDDNGEEKMQKRNYAIWRRNRGIIPSSERNCRNRLIFCSL